jgi:aryl-alcohol dehydrogenase-like predicted oxidoreductase
VTRPDEAGALLARAEIEVLQVPASLLDRRLWRAGFFAAAERSGRAVHVRSVLLQGVAHLPADGLPSHLAALGPVLRALDAVAEAHGIGRASLFLGWARHRLGAARVLIGCETRAQLEANLGAWSAPGLEAAVDEAEDRVPELPDAILDPWRWPAA